MAAELVQSRPTYGTRSELVGKALRLTAQRADMSDVYIKSARDAARYRRRVLKAASISPVLAQELTSLPSYRQTEVGVHFQELTRERQQAQRRDAARIGSAVSLLTRKGILSAADIDPVTGRVNVAALRTRIGTDGDAYGNQVALLTDHTLSEKSKLRKEATAIANATPVDTHPDRNRVSITIDPRITRTPDETETNIKRDRRLTRAVLGLVGAAALAACSIGILPGRDGDNPSRDSAASSARTSMPYITPNPSPSPDNCVIVSEVNGSPVTKVSSDPECAPFQQAEQDATQGGEKGKGQPEAPPTPLKQIQNLIRRVAPRPVVRHPEATQTPQRPIATPTLTPPETPRPTPILPSPTTRPTPPPPSPSPTCTPPQPSPSPSHYGH